MRIGEVTERTGLSAETIHGYEQVGLVEAPAPGRDGSACYTERDVERIDRIRQMTPLGLTVDEMRDLLATLDRARGPLGVPGSGQAAADSERLAMYRQVIRARCEAIREELRAAERFDDELARLLSRRRHPSQRRDW